MGEYINEKDAARRPSVIIVGAGAGGVATAARLAQAGCKVTVIEKNEFSGGRCSLIHRQKYVGNKFPVLILGKIHGILTGRRRDSIKDPVYYCCLVFSTRHLRIWAPH
jgi:phytoene dehydrogenase-like protein